MHMGKTIKVGNEIFEEIPSKAVAASKVLQDLFIKLGKPLTPLSKHGEQMMRFLIATWEDLYPKEVKEWSETVKDYRKEEMSIGQQVHNQTGRSLASIPFPIYQMMKKVFPEYKLEDKKAFKKFLETFPMFKMTKHT